MKKKLKVGILIFFSITLFLCDYARAKASNNINLGSQGGGLGGSGTNSYYWKTNDYGVRFTLVDRATGERKIKSIDYYKLSANKGGEVYHTKGKNKLEYMYVTPRKGLDIKRNDKYKHDKGGYAFHKSDLWNVITTSTAKKTSVKDIKKKWLSSEKFLKGIANDMGITLDTLRAKENMLIFEPILYIHFGGKYMALTSTEIGMHDMDARTNGKTTIKSKFVSFSHNYLPISTYLKKEKFGIKPYKGKGKTFTDEEIVAQMGIGMITSGKRPKKKKIKAVGTDYVCRTNTDVYTSLSVNASYDVSPDNPIRVDFHIPDVGTKSHTIYYLPKGYSQIAFVKWRTYEEERDVSILVSVNGMLIKELLVSVSKIPPWEPLNPRADDERPINLNGFNPNYNPESSPLAKEDLVKTETSRRWWEWFGEYQPRGDFLYWKANPIYGSIRVGKYSYPIVVGYYYTAQWEEIPYWSYGKHEYTI